MANTVLHKRSSVVENGQPKLPTSEQMKHGEIAINFASDLERISLKNADNEIVTFIPEHEIDKRIADVVASTSNLEIKKDENATHITLNVETVDGVAVYTIGESDIASASEVAENEEVTAQALTQLNDRLDVLEGEGDGSVAKAIDDAIAQEVTDRNAAIGEAKSELEGKIQDAVDGAKSYEIAKLTAEEITALSDANVLEAYKLIETGQTAAEGQIIKIYKDSSLQSVALVAEDGEGNQGQFLKFVYVMADGSTQDVYLNVSTFLHESEFGNGLQVSSAGVVSVKVDATSDEYLSVSANGIKLSGVKTAIDEIAENAEVTAAALTQLNERVGVLEGDGDGSVANAIADAIAQEVTDRNAAIADAISQEVSDRNTAIQNASDEINAEISQNEEATAQALTRLNDRVGALEGSMGEGSVADQITAAVDALANGAVADNTAAIEVLNGDGEGSVAKAVADAKGIIDAYTVNGKAISTNPVLGAADIQYAESVTVADAITALEAEVSENEEVSAQALTRLNDRVNVLESSVGETPVTDQIADAISQEVSDRNTAIQNAKNELLGNVSDTDAKTIAALNDRIDTVSGEAKSYNMKALTADEIAALGNANIKEAYQLQQIVGGNTTAAGDLIKIYKDSSLQSVALVDADGAGNQGQFLKFVYVMADGSTQDVYLNVSTFLTQSEFGQGLQVSSAGIVSVKVDATSESYLTVGADGIKLSGIDTIAAAVTENAEVAAAALTDLDERVGVLEGDGDGSVANQIADAISQEVTDRNTAIQNAADEINAEISQNEETTAQALTKLNDRVSTLEGSVGEGSVADQITDAVDALANGPVADNAAAITGINNKIAAMDATVESNGGTHVAVEVSEVDGVITAVNVTETDIASAQALSDLEAEVSENEEVTAQALTRLNDRVNVLESSVGETPVTDQIADAISQEVSDRNTAIQNAKNDLLGDAGADYNTLGKLEDKIQAVETAAKSYTMVAVTGQGENVREAYQLQQTMNGATTNVGEIIKIYKDSSLKSVALDGQTLNFTYILADGTESTVGVDVSAFLAESEFGNGLQVVDHVVSVKVDATSESYLTVGADGIKLAGVQEIADEVTENAKVAAAALTDLDSRVLAFESGDNSVANQIANAIGGLDVSDSAVAGQYVSAVSEVDGKITVSRATLPDVDAAIKAYVGEIPDGIEETNIIEIIENNELTTASALTELKTTKADSSAVANAIALANYMQGVNNVTSIASLPISKRLVVCTLSANGTLSMSSTPSAGNEVHVMVNNTSAADITVTIPTASPYVDFTGGTVTVPASGWAEINIISDGTNLYVRAI